MGDDYFTRFLNTDADVRGLTEAEIDARIDAQFPPPRYRETSNVITMPLPAKRPYIAAGCDQQSRVAAPSRPALPTGRHVPKAESRRHFAFGAAVVLVVAIALAAAFWPT